MPIKKGTMPPRYDEAFKAGAVKMVTEQGRPVKEVARLFQRLCKPPNGYIIKIQVWRF